MDINRKYLEGLDAETLTHLKLLVNSVWEERMAQAKETMFTLPSLQGPGCIDLVKAVRRVTGLGLAEALALVKRGAEVPDPDGHLRALVAEIK